jgi:eukaryotic-like serine/threonine-protein kinase
MVGKLVAVAVVGLFVLGGGAVGLGWWVLRDGGTTTAGNDPQPQPQPEPIGVVQPADPNPMVPTTVMEPLQPEPVQQAQPLQPEPQPETQPETQPEPQPVETTPTRETPRRPRAPSPADEARARQLVATGMGAARRNDFAGAVSSLRQAQGALGPSGRRHPITQELSNELSRRGSNQVGALLQGGRCPQAQALYRQLQSVGAAGGARQHFGDWCPAR